GEVRRLTDNRLLLCRAFANQVTDDYQPGGDPNPRLELDGFGIEARDRGNQAESRPDRTFGIVLMGSRVAEIGEHPVAHVFGDKTVEAGDGLSDRAVVSSDDFAQIFRVEARRQFGRADEIAEYDRQLAALGIGSRRCIAGWGCQRLPAKQGNGVEQLA